MEDWNSPGMRPIKKSQLRSISQLGWLVICSSLHKSSIYYLSAEARFLCSVHLRAINNIWLITVIKSNFKIVFFSRCTSNLLFFNWPRSYISYFKNVERHFSSYQLLLKDLRWFSDDYWILKCLASQWRVTEKVKTWAELKRRPFTHMLYSSVIQEFESDEQSPGFKQCFWIAK